MALSGAVLGGLLKGAMGLFGKSMDASKRWSMEAARAMQTSWKDEYWTIVMSIPMLMKIVAVVHLWWVVPSYTLNLAADDLKDYFIEILTLDNYYGVCLITLIGASVGVKMFGKKKGRG